jgi:hypothetical protein
LPNRHATIAAADHLREHLAGAIGPSVRCRIPERMRPPLSTLADHLREHLAGAVQMRDLSVSGLGRTLSATRLVSILSDTYGGRVVILWRRARSHCPPPASSIVRSLCPVVLVFMRASSVFAPTGRAC